jgi:transposase
MNDNFTFSQFLTRFPDDNICFEEIRKIQYPNGIYCVLCKKITKHYKLNNRTALTCKYCRNQIFPLSGTIFEKTSTPLRIWFYALFLMTQTRSEISIKQLQRELGVTYKTAWRMYKNIKILMTKNNGDLLTNTFEKIYKWTIFNKLEISVIQK